MRGMTNVWVLIVVDVLVKEFVRRSGCSGTKGKDVFVKEDMMGDDDLFA